MKTHKSWGLLRNIALALWALMILVIFMYFPGALSHMHRASLYDFSVLTGNLAKIPFLLFFGNTAISFLGMLFFGISCISLGMRLTTFLKVDQNPKADISSRWWALLATYFLAGNIAYSIIFLTWAALSHLSALTTGIILGLGFIAGMPILKRIQIPVIRFGTRLEKIFVSLSITTLVITIFQASSHLSYDASAIYFSVAKLTSITGHAGYYLENTFPVSVLHSVISFSVVMQIFGDQSARMISWLFGVVNIIIAIALADRLGASSLTKRILPLLILTSTAFLDQLGDGKVELFSSAYALAGIYWLILQTQDDQQKQIPYVVSGCFIGFSCILRPYNVVLLGIFVLVHFIQQITSRRLQLLKVVQFVGWMIVGAGGFAIYHLVLNKIILGSPFAFWTSVTEINPEGPWDFKPEVIWIYRFLYPFVVTFKNTGASLGNITPLVITFFPLLMEPDVRKGMPLPKITKQIMLASGISLLLWVLLFFAIVEVRYVIFLWIILFILISEIAARAIETGNFLLKSTVIVSILVLTGFVIVRSVFISTYTYSPLDKQGDPQCFDDSICGHFASVNRVAANGERVLTLSAYRYYLRTDLFTCSTTNLEYKALRELNNQNMDSFWNEVVRLGYTYVIYEKGYASDHVLLETIPSPDNAPTWMTLVPIFGKPGDLQVAYRIDVKNPPIETETTCVKNKVSGIWELHTPSP